jgi:hypothetical protein
MRARVLLAEAPALGVTIEDLVAESSGSPRTVSPAPTVAQYVDTVGPSFSKDVETKEPVLLIIDAQDVHVGQAHQKLTHARRVCFHGGSPVCWR